MAQVTHSSITCPVCGSQETIQVTMHLAGSPVSFTMCNACEWKGWEREGHILPLDSVLSLVSSR